MRCFRCQRPLTDIRSRARGYGSYCWEVVKHKEQPEFFFDFPKVKKMRVPEVQVGQIWKENDPRVDRIVRVEEISCDGINEPIVVIQPVLILRNDWVPRPGYRKTQAKISRFDGKRGGYMPYIEDGG